MSFYWTPSTFIDWAEMFVKTIPEFTFLTMAGFPTTAVNGVDWYLSAMFLGLLLIYPLARRKPKYFLYLFAPALAIFLTGAVFFTFNAINAIKVDVGKSDWHYFLYPGMFRALGEMCFGAWLVLPSQKLKELQLTKLGRITCTAVEVGCYLVVLIIMMKMPGKGTADFLLLLCLGIGIMTSFSHQGLLANFMDNKLSAALGKLSLDLFLSNLFWRNLFYKYLEGKDISYQKLMLQYLVLVFATALFIRLISFLIHKSWPSVKSCSKKLLLVQKEQKENGT